MVLSLCAVGSSLVAQQTATIDQERKCTLTFSPSTRPLADSTGSMFYVDQPVVASVDGGELWLGPEAQPWPGGMGNTGFAGVVKLQNGNLNPVGRPPNVTAMQMPMLLGATGSIAHVVWGDATTANSSDAQRILYSAFDGRNWKPSEVVIEASNLEWGPAQPATLTVGSRMYVATINVPKGGDPIQLAVSRRDARQWKSVVVAESRATFGILAARLQRGADNSLLMVYSGIPTSEDGTYRSALYVTRSADDGATWDLPRLFRWTPPRTSPMLGGFHRLADGTLHLFWMARLSGQPTSSTVLHEVSRDNGQSWQSADSTTSPNEFNYLITAQVGEHMVLTVRERGGRLAQALASKGATFKPIAAANSVSIPINTVRSADLLETSWGEYQEVSSTDRKKYGVAFVVHSALTTIKCGL